MEEKQLQIKLPKAPQAIAPIASLGLLFVVAKPATVAESTTSAEPILAIRAGVGKLKELIPKLI
jgi:hypothetical protein